MESVIVAPTDEDHQRNELPDHDDPFRADAPSQGPAPVESGILARVPAFSRSHSCTTSRSNARHWITLQQWKERCIASHFGGMESEMLYRCSREHWEKYNSENMQLRAKVTIFHGNSPRFTSSVHCRAGWPFCSEGNPVDCLSQHFSLFQIFSYSNNQQHHCPHFKSFNTKNNILRVLGCSSFLASCSFVMTFLVCPVCKDIYNSFDALCICLPVWSHSQVKFTFPTQSSQSSSLSS